MIFFLKLVLLLIGFGFLFLAINAVDMENTLTVGDGDNDLPMLREAGVGVLMGNADDETRASADTSGVVHCPSLEEEGFSRTIEQYVLN